MRRRVWLVISNRLDLVNLRESFMRKFVSENLNFNRGHKLFKHLNLRRWVCSHLNNNSDEFSSLWEFIIKRAHEKPRNA